MLTAALMVGVLGAQAAGQFYNVPEGVGISISSNGRYVIGYEKGTPYSSFILDLQTEEPDWFSNYDESNEASGRVLGVNDNGTVVGDMYDDDFVLDKTDVSLGEVKYDVPLHTAFVYKNGKKTKLDHLEKAIPAAADPNYFLGSTNGSYAVAINNEETLITGFLYYDNYFIPCYWEWDAAAGAWGAGQLYPQGQYEKVTDLYYRYDVTPDAQAFIAHAYKFAQPYQIYRYGQETVTIPSEEEFEMADAAISPDGKLVAFSSPANYLSEGWALGIYNVETGTTDLIEFPLDLLDLQSRVIAVTNDKKIYMYVFETSLQWAFYVCDFANRSFARIDAFLQSFGEEIEGLGSASLDYTIPVALSGDGKKLLGSFLSGTTVTSSYVVTLPDTESILPVAPDDFSLFYSDLNTLNLAWQPVVSESRPIDNYIVYVDGEKALEVETVAGEDGLLHAQLSLPVDGREHKVELASVIKANGLTYISESATRTIQVSSRTDVFFFDNIDDYCTYNTAGKYYYLGDNWIIETGNSALRTFECTVNSGTNYSVLFEGFAYGAGYKATDCCMTSRFLDASEATDMLLTFSYTRGSSMQYFPATSDCYLAVECSTDGEHWVEVFNREATSIPFNQYCYELIDISQWAGELFQVRFRVHSAEGTSFSALVDYIGVLDANTLVEGPTGLMTTNVTDDNVTLTWHNSTNEYELSYCPWQWSAGWVSCIGGDNGTIIAAVDFTSEMLAPYVGMSMSSVAGNIYDYQTPVCKGEAKIYLVEGSKATEIATGTFDNSKFNLDETSINYMYSCHAYLDEPVVIEAGKTYRVGIRLYDHASSSTPFWYCSVMEDDYIPGRTDLYSEDEGKTWHSLSDFYADDEDLFEAYGMAIFPIRLGISDSELTSKPVHDTALYAFDVYRNGEKINDRLVSFTEQKFADNDPLNTEAAQYAVRAYYRDGRVSQLSEPLTVNGAGISTVGTDAARLGVEVRSGEILIHGDFTRASLFTVAGQRVLTTRSAAISTESLPKGVYLVTVTTLRGQETYKIAIR